MLISTRMECAWRAQPRTACRDTKGKFLQTGLGASLSDQSTQSLSRRSHWTILSRAFKAVVRSDWTPLCTAHRAALFELSAVHNGCNSLRLPVTTTRSVRRCAPSRPLWPVESVAKALGWSGDREDGQRGACGIFQQELKSRRSP